MPPSEPLRVFISYAHKEAAELAQRLQSDLAKQGFDAWLDTQCIEGGATWFAVADEEHLTRIAKVPKREFMRLGVNQHTLEKILGREPVRAVKLAECLKVLEEYESMEH